MVLFAGNKFFRETGTISCIEASIGEKLEKECFQVFFNDETSIIVPKRTKVSLYDQWLEIDDSKHKYSYGTKSKYRTLIVLPEFTKTNPDPYLIGVAICSPLRNGALSTKDPILSNAPKEYYSFRLKEISGGYQITSEEDYPDLLKTEIKRQGNLCGLSERFIPDSYLLSAKQNRIDLLRGCMDVMGHTGKETTFETCSEQLAKDVSFLIRSLGGYCKTRIKKENYYIVNMSFRDDFNPFLLKLGFKPSLAPRIKSITKIESVGVLPCFNVPIGKVTLESFVQVGDYTNK